jgi:glycosyltransferase involved in cell wall biosynthesis
MNLICAGGGVFSEDEIKMFTSVNLYSKVQFIDISNDDILNDLYTNAFCFVFPSLYEGFGIPILESFTNSCPVVLSKASCFPEIAGSAALYFELGKAESLVEQLNALYYNKDLRYDLLKKSKEVLKIYSWTKMVDEHMIVYNSILDR